MMILAGVLLLWAAPARAAHFSLVEVGPAAVPFLRLSGAEELSPNIRLWRVPTSAVSALRRAKLVRVAEPDRRLAPAQAAADPDPLLQNEWWLADVRATTVAPPGPGVPVVVIDTGLDFFHPEFAGRPETGELNPESVVDSSKDFHGTAVASVIAAPANGVGMVGVYPQAVLRAYDADLSGRLTEAELIRGIETAAEQGRAVINLSLGGTQFDPVLRDVVFSAFRRGLLVVAASGNSGEEGNPLSFPANLAHVLTVAATDSTDRPAAFSSSSAGVDLAAPGVGITTAVPLSYDSTGYKLLDGTSFSAPIVSGAAAWVWTVRGDLDNTQLFDLMRFSARDVWTRGFDRETGFGILDVAGALARGAQLRDAQEPNDDVRLVEPGGLFSSGTPPLTSRAKVKASLRATLDVTEDPVDVYRVWVPAGRTVTANARSAHGMRVRVWEPATRSVTETGAAAKRDLAAIGTRPVSVLNASKRGAYYYADVRLARGVGNGTYDLSVATRARVKR
jgi:subtilisin family serine protease